MTPLYTAARFQAIGLAPSHQKPMDEHADLVFRGQGEAVALPFGSEGVKEASGPFLAVVSGKNDDMLQLKRLLKGSYTWVQDGERTTSAWTYDRAEDAKLAYRIIVGIGTANCYLMCRSEVSGELGDEFMARSQQ